MRSIETRDDTTDEARANGSGHGPDRVLPHWLAPALAGVAVAAAAGWVAAHPAPLEAVASAVSEMRRVLAGGDAS
jgi:hypothetical protein